MGYWTHGTVFTWKVSVTSILCKYLTKNKCLCVQIGFVSWNKMLICCVFKFDVLWSARWDVHVQPQQTQQENTTHVVPEPHEAGDKLL